MEDKKLFIVIDSLAIAYKSYFAHINRPLSNSKGEPTSATYGFLNHLLKVIGQYKPDYLAIAFDSKEKTFRHEKYDLYKSSRAEMPDDMIPQINRIKEIIEAFEIPILIEPRYEADDLIGTVVQKAEKENLLSLAVTPDKDYIQLITENIKILRPGKSGEDWKILDENYVKTELGFEPKLMIDYLGLVGDSSDDIPGVAGIGPKSATALIQEFGTIENIYKNIDNIKKKGIKTKLETSKENAFLSKDLATIELNSPMNFSFDKAKLIKPNLENISKLLLELEFKSLHNKTLRIFGEVPEDTEDIVEEAVFEKSYHTILTKKDAEILANKLKKTEILIFDTETDGLDVYSAALVGASFSVKKGEAYFVGINPKQSGSNLFSKDISDRLPFEDFTEIFSPIFADKKIKKVCQNGKFDIAILRSHGIKVNNFYFDTMLASYLIDADQKHGMDELSKKYLNYTPIPISNILGSKKDAKNIFDVEIEKLSEYAAEDADVTYRLFKHFKKLLKEDNLEKLAYEIEFPLVEVLEQMERNGVRIDKENLNKFSLELQTTLDDLTKNIYEVSESNFNINSTKQLQEILFNKLDLPKTKKTKTGFSTDAKSLEFLQGKHPIIDFLLEYRQIAKLKSTYADALPKLIDEKTNKIHTTYNQTIASTGRLSSVNPNLQNIPIRTELGREIRKAFIPTDENYQIFSADYSQIELRIMASICEDPFLTKAFSENADIHKSTAALVFEVPEEEVNSEMRRRAKEVNFGILYGIGAFGLSNRLGITNKHAKEVIETYFATFPNVKKFMDDSIEFARENGFAQTLLGRKRYLKNINSKNAVVRQFEERVAINMPIQGTAADLIKIAMIQIHKKLIEMNAKTKMILQVHDELVFDIHKSEIEQLKPIIIDLMENAMKLNVPLKVDTGIGENWLEAH